MVKKKSSSKHSKKTKTRKRADRAPRANTIIKKTVKKGLILVHTGSGKGKSTAAFGTAVRAMGRGFNVGIVQFIKGNWKTGEKLFFDKFSGQCAFFEMGEGFTWDTKGFERDAAIAQKAWKKCKELLHDNRFQLVIFDEINYAMKYNFLKADDVIRELKKKPSHKHVILTGNGAPKKLKDAADLVTEMKCIKHPYAAGIKAQPGIEY